MQIHFTMKKQELEKIRHSCKNNIENSCIGCSTLFDCKLISNKDFIDKLPCDWNSVDIKNLQKKMSYDLKNYKKV